MASFASVNVSSANKTIVPWSVVCLDSSHNFVELFQSVQAGKFAVVKTSRELSAAVLGSDGVSVGKDKSCLSIVSRAEYCRCLCCLRAVCKIHCVIG